MKNFLYSSVYSCHLFLISSASVRFIPFLSFIVPIFACNVPFVSLIFLKRSQVFPILLFSSISLHWSLRKAFLSLLAIRWNSAFKWECLPFLLCLSLLYSQLFVRPPQATILPFFFFCTSPQSGYKHLINIRATNQRRKWQPTPVFVPGESQGQKSLVDCCVWGRTELDMTEVT